MKKIFLITIITLFTTQLFSQTGAVKGFAYDNGNGEPMSFVTIGIKEAKVGAKTDNAGFFNIPKIPVGSYTLIASVLGFKTLEIPIEIKAGEVLSQNVYLEKVTTQIKQVTISSARTEKKYETKVGTNRITPKEMKILPSIGGEPDIAQFLQVMPGVISTGDQGGQLYIRGGAPIQNKILLDGMTIYNPFHSIGLYSVFETETIRSADVMSGGFGVEYGDRTSAIVNVTTKDGNKKNFSGRIAINPILAKTFLEGPLVRQKNKNDGSASFLLSMKHSFLKQSSSALYGSFGEPYKSKLPYTFTDVYGKINMTAGSGSKLNVFGFNFKDRVNFTNISDLKWSSYGLGTNFVLSPEGSSSLISGGVSYSSYKIGLEEADAQPRTSEINGFDANLAVTSYFKDHSEMKYGLEFVGFKTSYQYYNFIGLKFTQDDYTTQLGAFVKFKKNIGDKLIVEPGLRFQYYASLPVMRVEPRLALKYNISENVRLKGATGLYSQNLISSKSDRDIVNFFTGFLTAPDYQIADKQGLNAKNNIQKAYHIIGGIEIDINKLELTVEPWYKGFTQLININRYKLFADESDYLTETGKAYGCDFTAKYTQQRFYFWGVYSYGYVDRFDGEQNYPTPFDRRHNINLLTSYTFGKKADFEVSARFNFGSGFPFTLTQAFYEKNNFPQGIGSNYLTQNGNIDVLYDTKINAGRLPDYHRIDLSAKKRVEFKNKTNMEITASVTNAYNRQNIFYIDRIKNTRVYQLPIFPSLGINWAF